MKAIIILSLLVLSCFASHHLRRHPKELTPAQLAKILKGLSGHGGSSGSGSGSGSNEEFDFEGDQLAAKKGMSVEQILKLIQEGIAAGKDVTSLMKALKQNGGSSGSGSGSGSNEEFDFEAEQLAAKKQSQEDKIEQEIQEAILAGKDVTGLLQLLKQIKSLGGNGGSSGSGSGSNEEFDFEADQFATKHLNLQQVIALIAKFQAEGKDITKLMQIYNARMSGNNQEFDFEADELVAKKQSQEDKIEQEIQEALLAGKDVTGLLQLLKQIKSLGGNGGSSSGSGSNEEFDFEADQFHKQSEPHVVISVIH